MSATTWTIDPVHSEIGFAVKHMMFTTVRGRFTQVEGSIVRDVEHPENSSVEVSIEAASIDSRAADRDTHLRSADFFDVENHPKLTFTSKSIRGSLGADGDRFEITGDLTIRGVTKEVTLEGEFAGTGTDPWGGTRFGASAQTTIDRRDFGLTWNQALEAGGVLVGTAVKIELQVQAVQQAEVAAAAEG